MTDTHHSAVLATLSGALPEEDVRVEQAAGRFVDWRKRDDAAVGVERPTKKRRKFTQAWSHERLAEAIGVAVSTIADSLARDATFRAMLNADNRYEGVTRAEVDAAGRYLIAKSAKLTTAWSVVAAACVCCGKTNRRHHCKGMCRPCYIRGLRAKEGKKIHPFPDAWDTIRGHTACIVCARGAEQGVKHDASGMCGPCREWWRNNKLDGQSKQQQQRTVSRRRKLIAMGFKGGPSVAVTGRYACPVERKNHVDRAAYQRHQRARKRAAERAEMRKARHE